MKRFLIALTAVLFAMLPASAQSAKNSSADNIIGKYESVQGTDAYKVEVTKNADGTYKAQIYWMKDPIDPKTGKKALDVKNPDKSLRKLVLKGHLVQNGAKGGVAAMVAPISVDHADLGDGGVAVLALKIILAELHHSQHIVVTHLM